MAQSVTHWPLEAKVQSHACHCGICGGQNDIWTGFSEVFPVSIISVMLHTHLFVYH